MYTKKIINKVIVAAIVASLTVAAGNAAVTQSSQLMQPLDDEALGEVLGSGIGLAFEDFRYAMAPTSYAEQIGSATGVGTTLRQTDLRWYGLAISGANTAGNRFHFGNGSGVSIACTTSGTAGLGCPIGDTIAYLAAPDNPYIIRAFTYSGIYYDGSTDSQTVFEYLAPTEQDNYRFSFFGEVHVEAPSSDFLKSQTIILGNASDSIFRIFKFTDTTDPTVAFFYHSWMRGDFRFSVNQQTGQTSDVQGVAPRFEATEGLHFRGVDAFIPMGQLFYQGLILDMPRDVLNNYITDGNFILEVTRIPNTFNVYDHFYSRGSTDTQGYNTILAKVPGMMHASASWSSGERSNPGTVPASWNLTHGHARWGDWYPRCASPCSGTVNARTNTTSGMFYRSSPQSGNFTAYARRPVRVNAQNNAITWEYQTSGCTVSCYPTNGSGLTNQSMVNFGDSRVEGMLIHSLRITSLGAGI